MVPTQLGFLEKSFFSSAASAFYCQRLEFQERQADFCGSFPTPGVRRFFFSGDLVSSSPFLLARELSSSLFVLLAGLAPFLQLHKKAVECCGRIESQNLAQLHTPPGRRPRWRN